MCGSSRGGRGVNPSGKGKRKGKRLQERRVADIKDLARRELDGVFEGGGLGLPGRGVAVDVGDVFGIEGFEGWVDVCDGDVGAGGGEGGGGGEAEAGGAAGDEDGFAGEAGEVWGGD